ncbi:hypothetical protein EYF80_025000 [Liparis tanakae]|uniref:Uncharacterized protein n=1 Tax=Liparis tanakae TaxID=230148 RepID=A0A4Z2HHR5_9TELE|nr:hypothetical protein EYF80_025000 [Liparis tanakae]
MEGQREQKILRILRVGSSGSACCVGCASGCSGSLRHTQLFFMCSFLELNNLNPQPWNPEKYWESITSVRRQSNEGLGGINQRCTSHAGDPQEELVEHVMLENRVDWTSTRSSQEARPALLVLTAATSETALLAQRGHQLSPAGASQHPK